ncbi:MAG TPA: response regulator [Nitrososphaeraceae archaeon]|jgi:DNA-binding response OmpR family regulator|nr:response regulator [Nitrososphaeraceae archaeon]
MPVNKSILVVDDEFDIVNIIKQVLQKQGFTTYAFTDPLLALEHLKTNSKSYGLVLVDVRMPAMNGFELVKKIKSMHPTIKILLMSAFEFNDIELSRALTSIKIDGYIQKPVSTKELVNIIEKHLQN